MEKIRNLKICLKEQVSVYFNCLKDIWKLIRNYLSKIRVESEDPVIYDTKEASRLDQAETGKEALNFDIIS